MASKNSPVEHREELFSNLRKNWRMQAGSTRESMNVNRSKVALWIDDGAPGTLYRQIMSEKSYAHFNHSVVAASMKTRRFKINDRIGFLHCLSPNPPV